MTQKEQTKYEEALKAYEKGLLSKEEFMLAEAEFMEWSKSNGQLLNG